MQERNRFAFKEWAVVCEALRAGTQSLILRKGGIHEGREGFRIEHREFWLFPTGFHQSPDVLAPAAASLLDRVQRAQPASGTIAIRTYVEVDEVIEIRDQNLLPRLNGMHIWSESTLKERFHYRTPMLYALLVRVYCQAEPIELPDAPHFAGCRTWVDLPIELETTSLQPVVTDLEHEQQLQRIRNAIT